jgi:glycosyltransferase involved in cell wall biosynthesis
MSIDKSSSHPYLVSICIPTYNEPILFKRCLDSILSQDYPLIEIIISDDSSLPDIKSIVELVSTPFSITYKSNYPALKSPENWNSALDMASGDLVMLMHHDDLFKYKSSVRSFVEVFRNNPLVDLVFSTPHEMDEAGRSFTYSYSLKIFTKMLEQPHRLFVGNYFGHPSNLMFKKNIVRYRKDLVWMVDMEYYYQLIKLGLNAVFTSESFVITGVHENQTTVFCLAHPDIALREHILISASFSGKEFCDLVLYDHYWRQLRNNSIRDVHDPMLKETVVPEPILHMLRYLTILPVRLTFIGFVSKAMMLVSYLLWRLRSK